VVFLHFSGSCLSRATQSRSEFRRTSPLQASSFLSPVSFGKTKEIGSPPVDYRPLPTTSPQKQKIHSYQRLPHKRYKPKTREIKKGPQPKP